MLGLISEAVGHIVRSLSQLRDFNCVNNYTPEPKCNVVWVTAWQCPDMFLHAPPNAHAVL